MEEQRLRTLIEHPEAINSQDVSELETIIYRYPFFTVAQVLLAVGMKRTAHEKAASQLNTAAAIVPDRNVLRKLCTMLPDEYHAPEPLTQRPTLAVSASNGTAQKLSKPRKWSMRRMSHSLDAPSTRRIHQPYPSRRMAS